MTWSLGAKLPTPGPISAMVPKTSEWSPPSGVNGSDDAGTGKDVVCPGRRRCDVIYAMLKHGTLYKEASSPSPAMRSASMPGWSKISAACCS